MQMMTRTCRHVIHSLRKPVLLAGLLLVLTLLFSNPSAGSEGTLQGKAESIPVPVTFEVRLDPPSVRPGEEVRVVISMDIASGWHIYSLVPGEDPSIPPTNIRWVPGVLKVNGPAYETNPIVTFDPVVEAVLGYHEKRARFYQNFSVPLQPEFAKHILTGSIRYQACNERICLLPATKTIELSYSLEAGAAREAYTFMNRSIDNLPDSGSLLPSADSLASALSEGFWAFILLAVVMGMAAWLTPCVFPMIPVTVSYFSNQARRTNRNGVVLAVVFCLGIIVTYTLIGLVMAALVGAAAAIRLATNPWINIGIALLFTVFAFSLMGFFELQMPFGLTQKVDRISRRGSGILGVVLMGTTFTLTAFTCTVQFVGTLLVAAAYGQWLWPIIGMLVFSTVFALPFLFLALFPGWLQSVRNKSGTWMIRLKFMLGLLELVAVTKFLSNADLVWGWGLLNRTVVLGIWAILALCMSLVVLGVFPVPGISTDIHRPWKWIPATLLLTAVFYFSYGSIGRPLDNWTESYLPPAIIRTGRPAVEVGINALEKAGTLTWHATLASALEQSQKDGKPVFVDFTGYTCINCRWMEKNTFSHPDVHARFKNQFHLVRLYTDGGDNHLENQNLQVDRFKTIALPFYVMLSPDDHVLAKTSGISDPKTFIRFLDTAAERKHPKGGR